MLVRSSACLVRSHVLSLSSPDVDRARRRRDSITALENFFKGQVDGSGHSWLIDPKNLEFNALVGEGAFAKVYRGVLELASNKEIPVAIKHAKSKILATTDQVDSLKKEFEVMAAVGSPRTSRFPTHVLVVKLFLTIFYLLFRYCQVLRRRLYTGVAEFDFRILRQRKPTIRAKKRRDH
jgi:hypothetical protein